MEKALKENQIINKDKMKILFGNEVMEVISDPDFRTSWNSLYQSCPWATVFQGPEFVIEWYATYQHIYAPILVYAQSEGKLTGVLTLARGKKNKGIMAAGRTDAHYQVWLSEEPNKETFIQEALQLLRTKFRKEDIMLIHLPPDAPIEWIKSNPLWNKVIDVKPINRPLIQLGPSTINPLMSKKQYKQNLNRLNRLGELKLERITDPKYFESILDELILQYDFRQGAAHNRTPFQSNPLKKEFYIKLFIQKLLFVTVLWLDKKILASIISTKGIKGYIHGAGINTQSPLYLKYSPGFLNFIMFSDRLLKEGYKLLDLSTGGQAYKSRLASTSDTVYKLVFSPRPQLPIVNRTSAVLHEAVTKKVPSLTIELKKLKSSLDKNNMLFKEKLSLIKKNGLFTWLRNKYKTESNREILYEISERPLSAPEAASVHLNINEIKDLLHYEPDGRLVTKWEFLYDCMKRIEKREAFFTWTCNNRLLACLWLTDKENDAISIKKGSPNKEISLLHGFYVHENGHKELSIFLSKVKAEASKIKPNHQLYFLAKGDVKPMCPNLDVVHF